MTPQIDNQIDNTTTTVTLPSKTYKLNINEEAPAGAAGLVPAPTTSDTNKYLKSDGTWATVSGGGSYTAGTNIDITNNVISEIDHAGVIYVGTVTSSTIADYIGKYIKVSCGGAPSGYSPIDGNSEEYDICYVKSSTKLYGTRLYVSSSGTSLVSKNYTVNSSGWSHVAVTALELTAITEAEIVVAFAD